MTMIKFNETVTDTYDTILEDLLYELENIKEDKTGEIDFHSVVSQAVDNAVSNNSRVENLAVIDDTGNETTIDDGLVDRNADITRQIAQIAFGCLEQELFNDEFLCERLQTAMNNEVLDADDIKELIAEIKERLE